MYSITLNGEENKISTGKIVCIGRNYAEHAKELGNDVPEFPIIFLKPPSNLIYDGDSIIHPDYSNDLHHEVELVLLIGKKVKNASRDEAEESIVGYAVGLDMTLRDLQVQLRKKSEPWTLSKCFDTAAVVSTFIKKETVPDILSQEIRLTVNDEVRQSALLNSMIFKPVDIVEYISKKMTLEPGDLIYTGTPHGVSRVNRGDRLTATIDNFCSLHVNVI